MSRTFDYHRMLSAPATLYQRHRVTAKPPPAPVLSVTLTSGLLSSQYWVPVVTSRCCHRGTAVMGIMAERPTISKTRFGEPIIGTGTIVKALCEYRIVQLDGGGGQAEESWVRFPRIWRGDEGSGVKEIFEKISWRLLSV